MEVLKGKPGDGWNFLKVINDLSESERKTIRLFNNTEVIDRSLVMYELKLHRSTAWNVLSKLRKRGLTRKYGVGNGTYYRLTTPGNFVRVNFKYQE